MYTKSLKMSSILIIITMWPTKRSKCYFFTIWVCICILSALIWYRIMFLSTLKLDIWLLFDRCFNLETIQTLWLASQNHSYHQQKPVLGLWLWASNHSTPTLQLVPTVGANMHSQQQIHSQLYGKEMHSVVAEYYMVIVDSIRRRILISTLGTVFCPIFPLTNNVVFV